MKKQFKKVLLGSLALVTATSLVACGNKETTKKESKYKELIVDSITFTGDFFSPDFSNSSYDAQVINLTSATATFDVTLDGKLVPNYGVLEKDGFTKGKDADGNTTAKFKLRKDLKWSNGKPITANDYAFSLLYGYSPEWVKLGAKNVSTDPAYLGLEEYFEGKTKNLPFFRVLDDNTFEVTISKEALPYFYENTYYAFSAKPLEELGLGGKVVSNEKGVTFDGDLAAVTANIKKTQMDSLKPTVTYGKYNFEATSKNEVVLKLNPNYVGNYEGVKPTIQTIVIKGFADDKLNLERLEKGEVDVLPQLVEAKKINTLKKNEKVGLTTYDRHGYGVLGMANEFGATSDVNVRRALGHLVNRAGLVQSFLGGSGVIVNGEYSKAIWMYKESENELAKLNQYPYDVKLANAELDKSAYKFEKDGKTPFDVSKASATYLRHNDKGEELVINHLGTSGNEVTTTLESNLKKDSVQVGMKYVVKTVDFPQLLNSIKLTAAGSPEQTTNIYNLGTSFTGPVFDPYLSSYHSRLIGGGNNYRVKDDQLDKLSEEMRKVDPSNVEEYKKRWLAYQTRFNEILPVLPLYSSQYADAFTSEKIEKLVANSLRSWAQAIEYSRLK